MRRFKRVVVLTGAGISAESGVPTFRGAGGLWEGHRIEEVATPEAFLRNPDLVHRFYNQRRESLLNGKVRPNPGHVALADFEQKFPGAFTLVTQNVDDLHERAGSQRVIHMHGKLLEMRCVQSGRIFPWNQEATTATLCPCCSLPMTLRPNIVWFGEMPMEMEEIYAELSRCDLFVSIGTSAQVYPAAGFVAQVRNNTGAHTVELNLEPSSVNDLFVERLYGPASEIVPKFFSQLLMP